MLTGPFITLAIACDSDSTAVPILGGFGLSRTQHRCLSSAFARWTGCQSGMLGQGRSGTDHGLAPFARPRECPARGPRPPCPRRWRARAPKRAAVMNCPSPPSVPTFPLGTDQGPLARCHSMNRLNNASFCSRSWPGCAAAGGLARIGARRHRPCRLACWPASQVSAAPFRLKPGRLAARLTSRHLGW